MRVGRVLGNRVLVAPVKPYTDMDRVEKEGLLVIPQAAREANTPKESTGIVIAVGDMVDQEWRVKALSTKSYLSEPVSVWAHSNQLAAQEFLLLLKESITQYKDVWIDPPVLREGMAIMFGKHSGFEILVDEEEYRIIEVSDILCTIEFDDPSVVVPVKEE